MLTMKKLLIIVLLALPIMALSKSIWDSIQKNSFYDTSLQQYNEQVKINKKLKSDLAKSKDYYEVEKTIRNKLGKTKPNETELIIPRPTLPTTPAPTIVLPAYEQWRRVFF